MIAAKRNNDLETVQRIKERITWDKRVSLSDLNITMKNGTVVLNGYVDTSYKKQAAYDIVTSTEGVWSVENHIVVPSDYFRTDDEIKKIVEAQITDIIKLGGEHIEVEVIDGIVKLEGEVFRPRLKALASSIAWELSGVRDCLNFIDIVVPPHRVPLTKDSEVENILSMASN